MEREQVWAWSIIGTTVNIEIGLRIVPRVDLFSGFSSVVHVGPLTAISFTNGARVWRTLSNRWMGTGPLFASLYYIYIYVLLYISLSVKPLL